MMVPSLTIIIWKKKYKNMQNLGVTTMMNLWKLFHLNLEAQNHYAKSCYLHHFNMTHS